MAPLFVSTVPTIISNSIAEVVLYWVGMTMLNLELLSVPGSTICSLSQLRGLVVVRLRELDPRIKVQVAAILLAQGYES